MVEHAPALVRRSRSIGPDPFTRALWTCWQWFQGKPRREVAPPDINSGDRRRSDVLVDTDNGPVRARAPYQGARNATARIVEAFDAAHPVRRREDLYGRADKLDSLFEAVLFSRQHAIIHGARGSGKTSLSQIFGDYADQKGSIVLYTACEAHASFAELIKPYIAFIPDSCVSLGSKAAFSEARERLSADLTPRAVVDFLSCLVPDCQIILIFDEFDRVTDAGVNDQVATLMKLLSDARSPVQLILVGIARTVDEIIFAHPSLRRHLVPIPIGRISPEDVRALIDTGAARAGMQFSEDSKAEIVAVSCGSPYHAQLFCYVAAIEAARRERDLIDLQLTRVGLQRAFETWSSLNQDDAELFRALAARSEEDVRLVRAAAREAATHDCLRGEGEGVRLLGPALRQDHDAARFYFRDSAAPQLLLAMLSGQPSVLEAVG